MQYMAGKYAVYILGNSRLNLYIGVTGNLRQRVLQHKSGSIKGHTQKYKIYNLYYYEKYEDVHDAIIREKQLKKWKKEWKLNLIKKENPFFKDLANDWHFYS